MAPCNQFCILFAVTAFLVLGALPHSASGAGNRTVTIEFINVKSGRGLPICLFGSEQPLPFDGLSGKKGEKLVFPIECFDGGMPRNVRVWDMTPLGPNAYQVRFMKEGPSLGLCMAGVVRNRTTGSVQLRPCDKSKFQSWTVVTLDGEDRLQLTESLDPSVPFWDIIPSGADSDPVFLKTSIPTSDPKMHLHIIDGPPK